MTLDEDQWYILSVSESHEVVVGLVFLLKTSRVRTPETSEDYCKLSSGDVACEGGKGGACMRALHNPVSSHSKNKEKYHMGCSDHLKTYYTSSKAAFNILTQSSYYPISHMHYFSMITYFKSFQRQVKRAGMFIEIILNGSFKIPKESWSSLCS